MRTDVLKRKLRTLTKNPFGAIEGKMAEYRQSLRILINGPGKHDLIVAGRRKLLDADVLPAIDQFVSQRPANSIKADFDDLWYLYSTVRKRRPRVLLEFGSGVSTAVLARAVKDNGLGHLVSVDSDEYWTASTRASLPSDLRKYVTLRYFPADKITYEGSPAYRYAMEESYYHHLQPQFVYVDGPPLDNEVTAAVDVLQMRLPVGCCIIIDGRIDNMNFLHTHMNRRHSFEWRRPSMNGVFILIV